MTSDSHPNPTLSLWAVKNVFPGEWLPEQVPKEPKGIHIGTSLIVPMNMGQ